MGRTNSHIRRQTNMVRLRNIIQFMRNHCLPKLLWAGTVNWHQVVGKTDWHLGEIMADCGHTEVIDSELCLGSSFVKRTPDNFHEKAKQT